MTDEDTETKSLPSGDSKPKAPAPQRRAAPGDTGFGDIELGGPRLEPVGFGKRSRTGFDHALDVLGLVLSPPQLALGVTLLPLVAGTKPGLLAMLSGMTLAAIVAVFVQAPLLRYGLSLGVLSRAAFGWRGAKLVSLLRALIYSAFFSGAVFLSLETARWALMCAAPGTVAWMQRTPLLGGASLVTVVGTIVVALAAWLMSSTPSRALRIALGLPAVLLVLLLWLLPENLPLGTAWSMLDVVGRSSNASPFPVAMAAFLWASAMYLLPASDTRHQASQAGQTLAVAGAGVLPWLAGSLALALAVLSSGQSGDGGLFDLPALACRRLGNGLLVTTLGAAAIAFVWPLSHVAKRAVVTSVHEAAGGRASGPAIRMLEYAVLAAGMVFGIGARLAFSDALLRCLLIGSVGLVVVALVAATQYYLVDRRVLVLDELYSLRGPYRGVAGFLPAGWLSLAAGGLTFTWAMPMGYSVAITIGLALTTAVLGQAVLGNLQKLIWQRLRD